MQRVEPHAESSLWRRVWGFEPLCNCAQLFFRLCDRYSDLQPANHARPPAGRTWPPGPASKFLRAESQRNPEIILRLKTKLRRHNSDHSIFLLVEDNCLPDQLRIPAELSPP